MVGVEAMPQCGVAGCRWELPAEPCRAAEPPHVACPLTALGFAGSCHQLGLFHDGEVTCLQAENRTSLGFLRLSTV